MPTPETDLQLATLHDAMHGLREGLGCLRDLMNRRSAQALAEALTAEDDAVDDWPPLDQREPPRNPVWATPNLANVPEMEPLARAMGLRPDLKSSAAA